MEKENKPSLTSEYNNGITFYLNYLNPYFSEKNFSLFQKKGQSYGKLFQLGKEKRLENEEIKSVVKELLETNKNFSSLVKKYEKKTDINESLIEKELISLGNTELTAKIATDRQKVQNYLLGKIKRKFPDYSVKEVISIITDFLEEKK